MYTEKAREEGQGLTGAGAGGPEGRAGRNRRWGGRKEESESLLKGALLLLRDIAVCFAVIIVALQFVKPTVVFEHSMQDTLQPKDYLFLSKQAYRTGEPERGDIVVFRSGLVDDKGNPKNLIKRVIGLPGETVEVRDGSVWIDGARLAENYTKDGVTAGEMEPRLVPEGEYFMMGDNRIRSLDSRDPSVGYVARERIVGKVVFRLFPLAAAGAVG